MQSQLLIMGFFLGVAVRPGWKAPPQRSGTPSETPLRCPGGHLILMEAEATEGNCPYRGEGAHGGEKSAAPLLSPVQA